MQIREPWVRLAAGGEVCEFVCCCVGVCSLITEGNRSMMKTNDVSKATRLIKLVSMAWSGRGLRAKPAVLSC